MRMRKKSNLEKRILACSDYIIPTECKILNVNEAIKDVAYIDYESLFKNNNPIELEIGCGKGQFLCETASLHPEINYLGVEITSNIIITACERAQKENLTNIKFLNTNACYLPRYIAPDTISKIHLYFSNPLPNKPSEKLRLTSSRYLEIYKKFLVQGGEIFQKTDDMHFFEFSIEQLSKCGFILKNLSLDLHSSQDNGNIITEHERKFSLMGLPIYKLEAQLGEK